MLQEYVRNVSVVLVLCCNKCFHVVSYKCFYLDVAYVSHTCCKCMCNVSSASDVCCIQVFHVASISCFRGMFIESWWHIPDAGGKGATSREAGRWGARRA